MLGLYGEVNSALHGAARLARKGDRTGLATLSDQLDALGSRVEELGFRC